MCIRDRYDIDSKMLNAAKINIEAAEMEDVIAVSYTHLDVYKRQGNGRVAVRASCIEEGRGVVQRQIGFGFV